MLAAAIAAFFKFKIVGSVIIVACWPVAEQTRFFKELSHHGVRATFSCDLKILEKAITGNKNHQGILYMIKADVWLTDMIKVNPQYFSIWYKWLIIDEEIPAALNEVRYDADIALLKPPKIMHNDNGLFINTTTSTTLSEYQLSKLTTALSQAAWDFNDVYIHLREAATTHPWAFWSITTGFQIPYERKRQLRRLNLKKYPLRISTPMGHFGEGLYNGSFHQYLLNNTKPEQDSAIRCGYGGALLLTEILNATGDLLAAHFWTTKEDNRSMYYMLSEGKADLSGGILRPMNERVRIFDYVLPLWPFRVGFTYLAERESSSNMFVEPFDSGVWWACLVTGLMLVVVQRLTAKAPLEKDGAVDNVLATLLQQDASAVPEGASGRWTFTVLSLWAMLLHAYYTSAIVSALMSAGRSGPDTLQALGDSKYGIASEDYDYIRYLMFDRNSNWTELEYLKKKKMTSNFYQPVERGVELVRQGNTAYHTEFNHIYPHLKTFSDDHICKLSYVDTIPQTITWLVTSKHSQFTDVLRSSSFWLHETGLAKRLVSKWRLKPAPCRASLLAERVRFGDVAPLVVVASLGVVTSLVLLALEVMVAKKWRKSRRTSVLTT